jgi:NAD+ kinase
VHAVIARVGIVAKARLSAAAGDLADIASWLERRGMEPIFDTATASLAGTTAARTAEPDELPRLVDLIVVLGGDGTLLGTAGRIARSGRDIPILGVNFGGLGFLTEITLPELYPSLEAVLAGHASMDERMMLRSITTREGATYDDRVVLNDLVVTRGSLSRIIEMSVWVGDSFVTRFRSDGLIVASPTGSTAYNLAAGGPIIHPSVDALVITPIAPHTLTNRPIVVPSGAEVRLHPHVDGAENEIYVSFDGQFNFALEPGDEVRVRRAERPLRIVRASTRSYFEVLREKLKWGY